MKTNTNTQTDTLEVKQWKTRRKGAISIWDPKIIRAAIPESFKKLDPRVQVKNPVMFVVEIGSVVTTIEFVRLLFTGPSAAFPSTQLTYERIFVLAAATAARSPGARACSRTGSWCRSAQTRAKPSWTA